MQNGKLAEWSNATVSKAVDLHGSGGSNPSLSAWMGKSFDFPIFYLWGLHEVLSYQRRFCLQEFLTFHKKSRDKRALYVCLSPKTGKKSKGVSLYTFIHFLNVHTLDTKHRLLTRKTKSQGKFKKEVQWFFVMFFLSQNITKKLLLSGKTFGREIN